MTNGIYVVLMMIFASAFCIVSFWQSSFNGELISKSNNQAAEINQLTIERDVLLKVRCAEDSPEPDEEITVEDAVFSTEVNF
jgi:hypothetical protein